MATALMILTLLHIRKEWRLYTFPGPAALLSVGVCVRGGLRCYFEHPYSITELLFTAAGGIVCIDGKVEFELMADGIQFCLKLKAFTKAMCLVAAQTLATSHC